MIDGSKKENITNRLIITKMKTRITLVFAALLFGLNMSFAQQDEECMTNLTIFTDYYKSKKYDEAYSPWMKVRNKCPKFNRAIYAYGEKILEHKIENSTGADKVGYINDLMKLWDEALVNFSSNYSNGEVLVDKAELMYDYKKELGLNDKQIYDAFDKAFKTDLENFSSPRGLYIYFSTLVDLHNAGQAPIQDVFNKYDDVTGKIESEKDAYTKKLNELIEKEESGEGLSSKDEQRKASYNSYLENYETIGGSIDSKLGILANCENLIPLYTKDFETFKNDAVWLQRAVSRMYNKECTDDPLYIKLVKAYDETAPSADTKYFVASLLFKQGKNKEGMDYLNQSYDLETDNFKKAKLAYRIAGSLKNKGDYSAARNYYRKALSLSPSMGKAYTSIAQMYAASANSCGTDVFSKRAVYWLAAAEARKAARVDSNLASYANGLADSYEGKAPSRSMIFEQSKSGQVINIGCWIGASVTVPKL